MSNIVINLWDDPDATERRFHARSPYVERFWTSVLGPSASLIVRRVALEFDVAGPYLDLDVDELAGSLGLVYRDDRPTPFSRAFARLVRFNVAHSTGWAQGDPIVGPTFYIRRELPMVPERLRQRWPEQLHVDHRAICLALDEIDRVTA